MLSVYPMSKFRIVLKGKADQIRDGILRGLTQVFSLLGMSNRCCDQEDGRYNGESNSWTEPHRQALRSSHPLPAEGHTHNRPMLHHVDTVLSELAVLAEVDRECTIADHRMEQSA